MARDVKDIMKSLCEYMGDKDDVGPLLNKAGAPGAQDVKRLRYSVPSWKVKINNTLTGCIISPKEKTV